MCGRFAASASTDTVVEIFGVEEVVEPTMPRFNLAPTDPIPAVVERLPSDDAEPVCKLVAPRWGLVPSWSKDATGGARMINARVETVAEKPAFRRAFAARRCLIPADGYYEWRLLPGRDGAQKPRKQPYFIYPSDAGVFAMAGLYEFWKGPDGDWLTTATIITTEATDALGHLHDRMPMTVDRSDWAAWLDPRSAAADELLGLLVAPAAMASHPVSPAVGNVRNDGPELLTPVEAEPR